MVRTFVNSFKVSFTENANTFIYFLKRLPLIGKRIPDRLYKQTEAKLILGLVREVLGVLRSFLSKFLYLGIMMIFPSYLITNDVSMMLPIFLHMLFFLSFLCGPLMKGTIFDPKNKSAFDMIILMKADAREYYLGEMLYGKLTDLIYFILPIIIIGMVIGFSPLKAIILVAELTAFRFMGEWLHLFIYDKKAVILVKKNSFMFAVILIGLTVAYALPVAGMTFDFLLILFNGFVMLAIAALGAVSFIYLWNYKKYLSLAKSILTKDNIFNIENLKVDMNFASVKLDEKKMSKEDLNTKVFDNKKGYEYLNSLFFLRHRRIMVSPIKTRVGIIGVLFLIGMFIVLSTPSSGNKMLLTIQKSTPMLVFTMYFLSTGERICKALFYNCDSSLLRYTYYREGKVILTNFTSRLKRTVILNIIPAIALCISIVGIIVASGHSSKLISLIPLFLCIICLSCFFSIHYLFMYYVLQPYTVDLTVKSPLFKFINIVVYLISYICLQIKTSSFYFTLGVLITTIIYMAVALVLTYKVAPKTFKLRQ
jgi:hypothetical protein